MAAAAAPTRPSSEYLRATGPASLFVAGAEVQPEAKPNIVIAKAKIRIMRAGCAIICINLSNGPGPAYGTEPKFGMNYIAGLGAQSSPPPLSHTHRWTLLFSLIVFAACGLETSESADTVADRNYEAQYRVRIDPAQAVANVTLEIRQPRHLLRELRFPSVSSAISGFSGDGEISTTGDTLRWLLPAEGGELSWQVVIAHPRGKNTFDAWLGPDWGMFRAEDIVPRARTRSLKGSTSNTNLRFDLPRGWSVVTEYSSTDDLIVINRPERRFDQPTGWIVVGDIGVRRETIAGVRVAVAGPQGHAVRRMDMLALLNWTLPELVALLPEPPARLTIVSAGEPMWRGGLSAPASLFIHADRPLISENATSTLVHEAVHAALSLRSTKGADWIVEGLAEYYSLELLKRGGAITGRRYDAAIIEQADWGSQTNSLCGTTSSGATTALAVTVFRQLDQEILDKTATASNLDTLLGRLLVLGKPVDLALLSDTAAEIIGEPSDVLHSDNLPGCTRMMPGDSNH